MSIGIDFYRLASRETWLMQYEILYSNCVCERRLVAKIRVESTKITQTLILGKFHELYSDRYILSDETLDIIKILSSEVR
jgi:hypothetical protein